MGKCLMCNGCGNGSFPVFVVCQVCNGSKNNCTRCNGSGKMSIIQQSACYKCGGSGMN